jgi:hypothetical protein
MLIFWFDVAGNVYRLSFLKAQGRVNGLCLLQLVKVLLRYALDNARIKSWKINEAISKISLKIWISSSL